MKTTEIDLIRHAESVHNLKTDYVNGLALHSKLTDYGIEQAKQLARHYHFLPADTQLYSSTAERAKQTARIAFPPGSLSQLSEDERLLEISKGDYEGMLRTKLYTDEYKQLRQTEGFDHRPPNGESINDGVLRLVDFIHSESVEHRANLAAVSHSYLIGGLAANLSGITFANLRTKQDIFHGSTTRIRHTGRGVLELVFVGLSVEDVEEYDQKYGKRPA